MPKYLTNLEMNQNEIQKAVVHKLTAAPVSPVEGQIYHNTVDHHFYFRTDLGWQDVTNAITVAGQTLAQIRDFSLTTGTRPATAISDFSAASDARIAAATITQAQVTNLGADLGLKAALAGPTFTGVPLAPTAVPGTNTTQISTTGFVIAEIAARFAANDAMSYKGAIDASLSPNYPAANSGDTYRISVAGKIGGATGPTVEVGDIIISHVDASASNTHALVGTNWDIIQTNIDGAVTVNGIQTLTNKTLTAPIIATISNTGTLTLPTSTDTLIGRATADLLTSKTMSGASNTFSNIPNTAITGLGTASTRNAPATGNAAAAEVVLGSDTRLGASSALRFSADLGDAVATSFIVTHSLGTRDLIASVRSNTTPWEVVIPDVEMTSLTTATIRFAVAPAAGAYRLTLVG